MDDVEIPIEKIYVPVKRQKTLEPDKVTALAEDILENGQQRPVMIRRDEARFVLVEGLHRLEAMKSLGEETIVAVLVHARRS